MNVIYLKLFKPDHLLKPLNFKLILTHFTMKESGGEFTRFFGNRCTKIMFMLITILLYYRKMPTVHLIH